MHWLVGTVGQSELGGDGGQHRGQGRHELLRVAARLRAGLRLPLEAEQELRVRQDRLQFRVGVGTDRLVLAKDKVWSGELHNRSIASAPPRSRSWSAACPS